jgi:hypothetical protein
VNKYYLGAIPEMSTLQQMSLWQYNYRSEEEGAQVFIKCKEVNDICDDTTYCMENIRAIENSTDDC